MIEQKYRIATLAFGILMMLGMTVNATTYCSTLSGSNFKIISVIWGNSTHPVAAGPGQRDVPLTVTLESYGNQCELQGVQGYLQLYGGFSNYNGSAYAESYQATVQPYSTFSMVFYLNIADNVTAAPNKTFTYPLYISYNYTNETSRNTQFYNLAIPFGGAPQLSFNVKNHALVAGAINNVTVEVTNSGSGYASDVSATPTQSSNISLVNQTKTIPSIAPNQTKNISMYLYVSPGIAGQATTLPLNTQYITPYGYNTSSTVDLSVYALPISQSEIVVSASTYDLVSGSVDYTNITIKNNGSSQISNLTVQLSPQSPLALIGSDGFYNIPSLSPGETYIIPVQLYLSSSTNTVSSLVVNLDYATQTSSRTLSFLAPGYINITSVSTTLLPSNPSVGSIFSLTSTLNNLGTTTASSATVTAYPPNGLTIVGQDTTFIGSIPTDTPTAFTMSFIVSQNAKPGRYTIPVTLTYSNNLNQRENTTFQYSVNVSAYGPNTVIGDQEQGQTGSGGVVVSKNSGTGLVIPIIIVVIIAAVAYYLYGRRKKRKISEKEKGK